MTRPELFEYTLRIADNCLIYGQRLSEWCGHGPVLEEDIALANTSLDYLGQATSLLKYAATVEGAGRDEDQLAFLRDIDGYKNLLMVELPNGDYATTIARQFMFSSWYYLFLEKLQASTDDFLKGFAGKSIKELRYHVQHSRDWVLRMGDGTENSHNRIQKAFNELWEYTPEFFMGDELDAEAVRTGTGVDLSAIQPLWRNAIAATLEEATLQLPADGWGQRGGRSGKHTEHMGFILAEMQYMQRTYPGAKW
jgi:ring-1,2-phenylacetyl-CoA epoxidase subunit PaaC